MVQRWRVHLSNMQQLPTTVQTIVEACVCLHDFIHLLNREIQNVHVDEEDHAHNLIPANLLDSQVLQGGNRDNYSQEIKGLFKSIFQ